MHYSLHFELPSQSLTQVNDLSGYMFYSVNAEFNDQSINVHDWSPKRVAVELERVCNAEVAKRFLKAVGFCFCRDVCYAIREVMVKNRQNMTFRWSH